ncbi:hypothetical protein BT69DRAFT_1284727 [Atractiella rhizophila]|nr:hypothetical protein BT69DRAFT_1284727 [Atractiella rhizophila]
MQEEEEVWGAPASSSRARFSVDTSGGSGDDGFEEASFADPATSVAPAKQEKEWGTFGEDVNISFGASEEDNLETKSSPLQNAASTFAARHNLPTWDSTTERTAWEATSAPLVLPSEPTPSSSSGWERRTSLDLEVSLSRPAWESSAPPKVSLEPLPEIAAVSPSRWDSRAEREFTEDERPAWQIPASSNPSLDPQPTTTTSSAWEHRTSLDLEVELDRPTWESSGPPKVALEPVPEVEPPVVSRTHHRWESRAEREFVVMDEGPAWESGMDMKAQLKEEERTNTAWTSQAEKEFQLQSEMPSWESGVGNPNGGAKQVEAGVQGGFGELLEKEMKGEVKEQEAGEEWGAVSLKERKEREPKNVPAALIDKLQRELASFAKEVNSAELKEDAFDKTSFVSDLGSLIRNKDELNQLFHDLTRLPPLEPITKAALFESSTRKRQTQAIVKTASNAAEILIGTSRIPTGRFASSTLAFNRPRVSASYFEDTPSPIKNSFAPSLAETKEAHNPPPGEKEGKGLFGGLFGGKRGSMSLSGISVPSLLANRQPSEERVRSPTQSTFGFGRSSSPAAPTGVSTPPQGTISPSVRTSSPALEATPKSRNIQPAPSPVMPTKGDLLLDFSDPVASTSKNPMTKPAPQRTASPSRTHASTVSRLWGRFSQASTAAKSRGDDEDDDSDDGEGYDYGRGLIKGGGNTETWNYDDDDVPLSSIAAQAGRAPQQPANDPFDVFNQPVQPPLRAQTQVPPHPPPPVRSATQISSYSEAGDAELDSADDGFDDFISSPNSNPIAQGFEPIRPPPPPNEQLTKGHKPSDSMSSFFRGPLASGSGRGHNKTDSMSSFFREPLRVPNHKPNIPATIPQSPLWEEPPSLPVNGKSTNIKPQMPFTFPPPLSQPSTKPAVDLLDFDDFISAPTTLPAQPAISTVSFTGSMPSLTPMKLTPTPQHKQGLSKADLSFFENL